MAVPFVPPRAPRVARAALLALLAACGGGGDVAPLVPAAATAAAGTAGQSAVVNTAVALAPAVVVTTTDGKAVAGVPVTFTIVAGGGALAARTAVTDRAGRAAAGTWTLGTAAGTNSVVATVATTDAVPTITFTATATPGPTTSFAVSPSSVVVGPGGTQALTLVSAVDQYGNAIDAPTATWASQATGIATVSAAGVVTGVASGSTTVTVTSGSATRTVPVTVASHPTGASTNVAESNRPFGIAISSAGVAYATELDADRLGRYTVATSTLAATGVSVGSLPTDVTFSPNGATAYVATLSAPGVDVVDVASGTRTRTIPLPAASSRLLLSPDGGTLYVGLSGSSLAVINTATSAATEVPLPGAGGVTNGLALNPKRGVYYATSAAGMLYELDRASNAVLRSVAIGGRLQDVVVSADGARVFVANESGTLEVYDAATLARAAVGSAVSTPFGLALSRDGLQLYVSRPSAGVVTVIDAKTYAVVASIPGGTPRRIAFDALGTTALIANEAGWVTFVR